MSKNKEFSFQKQLKQIKKYNNMRHKYKTIWVKLIKK
jgi:hypothetical protein